MRQYSLMIVRGQRRPTRQTLSILDSALGKHRRTWMWTLTKPAQARFFAIRLPFLKYFSSPLAADQIAAGTYAAHHMFPMGSRWS